MYYAYELQNCLQMCNSKLTKLIHFSLASSKILTNVIFVAFMHCIFFFNLWYSQTHFYFPNRWRSVCCDRSSIYRSRSFDLQGAPENWTVQLETFEWYGLNRSMLCIFCWIINCYNKLMFMYTYVYRNMIYICYDIHMFICIFIYFIKFCFDL